MIIVDTSVSVSLAAFLCLLVTFKGQLEMSLTPDSQLPKTEEGQSHLPRPEGGSFPVGFVDIFSPPRPQGAEGVLFRLFYPTHRKEQGPTRWGKWFPHIKYSEGYLSYSYAKLGSLIVPLLGRLFVWLTSDPLIPAEEGGAYLPDPAGRPLVVFSHGLAGCRATYSYICTSLSSRGYLVAALEHGDGSACLRMVKRGKEADTEWKLFEQGAAESSYEKRNTQVKYRAGEMSHVLDILEQMNQGDFTNAWMHNISPEDEDDLKKKFVNTVDFKKVTVGGHSFGGASAVLALASDTRYKGGVALDTWLFPLREEELLFKDKKPFSRLLFVNCEKFQEPPNLRTMKTYEGPPGLDSVPSNVVTLRGATHQASSDLNVLLEGSSAGSLYRMMKGGGAEQTELTNSQYLILNSDLFVSWVEKCLTNETSNFVETIKDNRESLQFGIVA